jgi:hypothetical protein
VSLVKTEAKVKSEDVYVLNKHHAMKTYGGEEV